MPPPAPPPFFPKQGPREGSRSATQTDSPSLARPCAKPILVVVLPSPNGVGVIEETSTRRGLSQTGAFSDHRYDLGDIRAISVEVARGDAELCGYFLNASHTVILPE